MHQLLLDSASLYFRAFYALPTSIRTPDGHPINAVRGFLETLVRLAEARRPEQVVCCWDEDWRPQWRVDAIASYKAHRVSTGIQPVAEDDGGTEEIPDELEPQVPILRRCLDALGVPVVGAAGYEADDVIATLATRHTGTTDVVSGDRDLMALADATTTVLYTGRPRQPWLEVTPAVVLEQYGVPPERYPDLAVLRGDTSDGLPGVRGIGEKTAARLIAQFGSLEGVLSAAHDPGSRLTPAVRQALLTSTDYIDAATLVVTLVRTVPLQPDAATWRPVQEEEVLRLADQTGLARQLRSAVEVVSSLRGLR